ncbi:hypothetical protein DM02DRAFT_615468 [Periconia macrospinosa]|uniref:Uncharacterized protein n=1 Tax=Periconia macrospinosa TaxID=97972 RepID=A0A2V1DLG4_9PLEO|nr:hypothetical protein DM02DRAFT_615468 [Periconia macrospinosa]
MFRPSTHLPRTLPRLAAAANPTTRFLHTTRPTFAAKNTQDKDSLDPQSNEYSKSGSDQAAASSSAAFDPNTTSPEGEQQQAEKDGSGNPLKVSPGNDKVSKPRADQEGGAQNSPRTSSSGGGSAPKSGGGKSG